MPVYSLQQQNHFYWRAGFGPTASMLSQPTPFNPDKYFKAWLIASEKQPQLLQTASTAMEGLSNGLQMAGRLQARQDSNRTSRQDIQRQRREEIRSLNLMWLNEMVSSPAQLREKMAFFWHGHFACRNLNSFYQQQLLHEIRVHALGNFGDLLRAVSKSPAMLAFLNNQQNRKQSPNENFAREVMELFTLGRGNYGEEDIKEAARAFTGWGFTLPGEFVFRQNFHDGGSKTVLGKTGNFDGDDVLAILLERKETATFVTRKLYKFLVNDVPDEERVRQLANSFYQSGYDIKSLLKSIFTADWFYASKNQGSRIKSPVELWVGLRRMMPVDIENEEIQLLLQRGLGQVLLYPPTVAGWPGGKSWIDSSSLLLRMQLPQLIARSQPFELNTRADDDITMGMQNRQNARQLGNRFILRGSVKWQDLINGFKHVPAEQLSQQISASLLQKENKAEAPVNAANREDLIVQQALWAMSLPEYQLC